MENKRSIILVNGDSDKPNFVDDLMHIIGEDSWNLVVSDSLERNNPEKERAVVLGWTDGTGALQRAGSDSAITSAVLVNAFLTPADIELIEDSLDLAILTVVDPKLRDRIGLAVKGHLASRHEDSDILIKDIAENQTLLEIGEWLVTQSMRAGGKIKVNFGTPDGWDLHADLWKPETEGRVPGIVLMHSGRSDRSIFGRLSRLLSRAGFVVLNLDWRGRGMSTNKGYFVDFSPEEQADVSKDIGAAFDWLSTLDYVDSSRLGVLGVAHGANYAVSGALGDPRTRAIVLLTGFHTPDERQRAQLTDGSVSVLYISGTPHVITTKSMRTLYELSRDKKSRFIEYSEGVLGYQFFDLHPDLEPTIVEWFREVFGE